MVKQNGNFLIDNADDQYDLIPGPAFPLPGVGGATVGTVVEVVKSDKSECATILLESNLTVKLNNKNYHLIKYHDDVQYFAATPHTIYTNLSYSMFMCVFIFALQSILVWNLVEATWTRIKEGEHLPPTRLLAAFFLQLAITVQTMTPSTKMSQERILGVFAAVNSSLLHVLKFHSEVFYCAAANDVPVYDHFVRVSKIMVFFRFLLHTISETIFKHIVIVGSALYLVNVEHGDFVKDAFALVFIVQVDLSSAYSNADEKLYFRTLKEEPLDEDYESDGLN